MVAVRDVEGEAIRTFVDGIPTGNVALSPEVAGPLGPADDGDLDPILIGAVQMPGSEGFERRFTGEIDELSFYASALVPDDIKRLVEAGPLGKCH